MTTMQTWKPYEWNDKMSVGIAQLDDDHKGLIAIINRLGEALYGAERNKAALEPAFRALRHYMKIHFAREEEVMRAAHYPEFEAHKPQHRDFIEEINDMRERFEAGADEQLLGDLTSYLRDWLVNHIMVEDMAYKPYLSGNDDARRAAREFSGLAMWNG
ncbi:MAG: bacteriohemerythrin [Alphaproteobacteria bacterium]